MTIEIGTERGYIDPKTHALKVLLGSEGIWVHVVAMKKGNKEGIGILMNNPFLVLNYSWGALVHFKEDDPTQIPKILHKIHQVPNNKSWKILE